MAGNVLAAELLFDAIVPRILVGAGGTE